MIDQQMTTISESGSMTGFALTQSSVDAIDRFLDISLRPSLDAATFSRVDCASQLDEFSKIKPSVFPKICQNIQDQLRLVAPNTPRLIHVLIVSFHVN
jgi:hypothetical protein